MSSRREDRRRTEQRLAASKNLDRMTAAEIVRLMNREDRKVAAAVARELPAIARAVDEIVEAVRGGGRLIYVGAGSSGRMAVLDAAECPPTFGISKKKMIALIAGGRRAVTGAVEGAEDSAANGAQDLRRLKLGKKDVVVGIAASGTTPYVLSAMKFARGRGATTVAVIAGGRRAVTGAVEGAEDSAANGARDLRLLKLGKKDVVVGIAASGTTPYVLSAMKFARGRGAMTVAVMANRDMPVARLAKIAIAVEVGAEVLTGSTRLKAGTSQKMVLNMLSTAVMARLGHVYENLMIDAVMTNKKLQGRAVRILMEASGAGVSAAEHALRAAGHDMRVGLVMLKLGVGAREARNKLATSSGDLRVALGE